MPGEVWIGYTGTLGTSYDLPLVFDALKKVEIPNLRFIVMGDGPMMEKYMEDANGLNVTFTGRIPYDKMCGALCACDMVVNPIVGTSVASIINKHADYAACGRPVLNTQESEEYRRLVESYQMGFNCVGDLAQKIREFAEDDVLRVQMGRNARRCAEERFDRKHSYYAIVNLIEQRI